MKLHTGVSYRHLSIIKARDLSIDELTAVECEPPTISRTERTPLMYPADASRAFCKHSWNDRRPSSPTTGIARAPAGAVNSRPQAYGYGAKVVPEVRFATASVSKAPWCRVDLINGIGVCAGLKYCTSPAHRLSRYGLRGKSVRGLAALERVDFVCVHVEAPTKRRTKQARSETARHRVSTAALLRVSTSR